MRRTLPVAAVLAGLAASGCQLVFSPDHGGGGDDGPDPGVPTARILFASPIAVEGLPVPIRLDAAQLDLSGVTDYKEDLRFVGPGGDRPFEIEHWDAGGESVVWVLPAPLVEGPNDELTMYYGRGANGEADPRAVWGPDYAAVWHLSDSSGPANSVLDSTGNYPGSADEPSSMSGAIGRARWFGSEGSESVTFANSAELFSAWSEMTLELFMWADGGGAWIEQGEALGYGDVGEDPTAAFLRFEYENCTNGEESCPTTSSVVLNDDDWNHLAYTYDGEITRVFHNGAFNYSDAIIGPTLDDSPTTLVLGSAAGSAFDGGLDEVRISYVHRDDAYFAAAYATGDPAFVEVIPN